MITLSHYGCEVYITGPGFSEKARGRIAEIHENSGAVSIIVRFIGAQNISTYHFKRVSETWFKFDSQKSEYCIENRYSIELVPTGDSF